jgi:hypothetical protein
VEEVNRKPLEVELFLFKVKPSKMKSSNGIKVITLFVLLFFANSVFSQDNRSWGWVKHAGSNQFDSGSKIQTDENGNVYVCMNYGEKIVVEGDSINSPTYYNNFCLIKYNRFGQKIWIRDIRSSRFVEVTMLEVDADENVYIGGVYSDSLVIGNSRLTGSVNSELSFVARLNRQGAVQWLNKLGSGALFKIASGKLSQNGNIILAGNFTGAQQVIGSKILTTIDVRGNFFVASMSTAGAINWATNSKGYYNVLYDLAVDRFNNIYICGTHNSGISIDGMFYLLSGTSGGYETYIIKMNPLGAVQWAKSPGSESTDMAQSLAVDNDGNCFVAGYWGHGGGQYQAVFDSTHIISKTPGTWYSFFLAKYNPVGKVLWVQKFDELDNASDMKHIVRTDTKGNCYLTGHFTGIWFGQSFTDTIAFSGKSSYYNDIAIQQFKPNGERGWNIFAGNKYYGTYESVEDMAFDRQGGIWITGAHGGYDSLRIGTTVIPNQASLDYYVTKLGYLNQKVQPNQSLVTKGCFGEFMRIPFTVNDTSFGANNVFSLQISNEVGLFNAPTTIATKTTNRSDTFMVQIPKTLKAGIGYRFRLVASNPAFVSFDNGQDFIFYEIPLEPVISVISDTILSCNVQAAISYQWFLNDTLINGAVTREHKATRNGLYKVVVSNTNGCRNEDTIQFVRKIGVGIIEFENENRVTFYPNPVSGQLHAVSVSQVKEVVFFNAIGQQIKVDVTPTANGFMVNTDGLPEGMYIILLRFDDKEFSQKIQVLKN